MKQGLEALPQLDSDKESRFVDKKWANILPFRQKPFIEKRGADIPPFRQKPSDDSEEEIGHDYDKYMALGGRLSQKEYREVMERAGDETISSSKWSASANSMARAADITISPETVTIYGILRDEKPDPKREHYSELSDQKLLAEALLIIGDKSSWSVFVKKHPHIFN